MPNKRPHKYRYIFITLLLILLISSSAFASIPKGAAAAKATGGNALTGAATAIEGEKNNRQLHKSEQQWILELASSYAKKNNITEEEAKQILMQTALRLVDDQWNKTYDGSINTEARDYLLANTRGLTFYNPETGTNQGFLTTTKEQYMDTTSLLHEAFSDGGINNYQKYAALGKNILDNIQYSAGVVSPAGVREESGQLKPSGVGKVGIETIREVINLGKTVLDAQTWTTLYNMIENAANDPGKAWESFKTLAGQMPSEAVKKLESQWYEHELYRMQDRDFTAGQKVQEWTATVALAVVGTKGLDKLAKGGSLLKLGDKAEDLYSAAKQAEKVLPEGLGKTVLGHYPEYIELADKLNAKRFNIPSYIWNKMSDNDRWAANQKFLDKAISRGDEILLSTKVKNIDNVTGYFRKELDYLIEKGYRFSADGLRMTK
ncbi:MAG: hypothetical protein JXR79_09155 [Nitrospirae bacterium]|nr:hypothetical protein [Nitrospirota bacterium]